MSATKRSTACCRCWSDTASHRHTAATHCDSCDRACLDKTSLLLLLLLLLLYRLDRMSA